MSHARTQLEKALAARYAIEGELGAGAAARVYRALDLRHNRAVALKVLRPELAAALGADRFLAEIRITAGLNHPNVVSLYDSGEADGFLYYVMPVVEGETLRQKLAREKQLGIQEALSIVRGLAEALTHAHARGIVHRDIKPENILLHHGVALLADFGVARAIDEAGGERLTTTGISIGTPAYMSPEQAAGDRVVGPASDIYGLATVLYEMLAGDPPFLGTNTQAVIAKVLGERPAPLRIVRGNVPASVEAAIERALAKVPADRFGSVAQFAAALTQPLPAADATARSPATLPSAKGNAAQPVRLFEELKRRRVFRAAIAYAGVAFIILQGAPPVLQALRIADWVMTLTIVLLIAGFPVVLLLSWLFEWTPEGQLRLERPPHGLPAAEIRGWSRRRVLGGSLGLVAVVLVALAARGWFTLVRGGDLASDRVMVFPLVVPADFPGPRSIGEDVATMIGNVLDGTGALRWVDGWALLQAEQRDNPRELLLTDARELARAQRSAYFLTGRVVSRGDSIEVFLALYDVRGDSVIAHGSARGARIDAWRQGVRAVNDILPSLIPGPTIDVTAEWKDREPAAIANFLLGEAAFRRVHMADALNHYRAAVGADSSFALAAIRGAQAATWNHRSSEAAALIQVALRQTMPDRFANFARGYQAYLEGSADSAVASFRRVLRDEPELAVAWAQLGEVYMHLLSSSPNPDSLAEDAFAAALRSDPSASNQLFHLIEIRLRQGDVNRTAELVRQFLEAEPDSALAAQIEIMNGCVRSGAERFRWRDEVVARPFPALMAALSLAAGGAQVECASRGFAALLTHDTATTGEASGRRWSALIGAVGIRLARGGAPEAALQIDSFVTRWGSGATLYLLMAPFVDAFAPQATSIAEADARRYGANYASIPYPTRLWELGLWAAHTGNLETAAAVQSELETRAQASGTRRLAMQSKSVEARLTLARGDTTRALELLQALAATHTPSDALRWDEAEPLPGERLLLAHLLHARGDQRKAIEVANVFDSAWPTVYVLYLPLSLELRAAAAGSLGDEKLQSQYRARLARLQSGRAVHP